MQICSTSFTQEYDDSNTPQITRQMDHRTQATYARVHAQLQAAYACTTSHHHTQEKPYNCGFHSQQSLEHFILATHPHSHNLILSLFCAPSWMPACLVTRSNVRASYKHHTQGPTDHNVARGSSDCRRLSCAPGSCFSCTQVFLPISCMVSKRVREHESM